VLNQWECLGSISALIGLSGSPPAEHSDHKKGLKDIVDNAILMIELQNSPQKEKRKEMHRDAQHKQTGCEAELCIIHANGVSLPPFKHNQYRSYYP